MGGGFSRPPSGPSSPRPRGYGAPPPVRPARRGYEGRYGAPPPRRSGGFGRSRGGCLGSAAAAVVVVVVLIIVLVNKANNTCLSCLGCGGSSSQGNDKPNGSYSQNSSSSSSKPSVVPSPTVSSGGVTVIKNKPTAAFSPDCIIDELNWFDDVQKAGEDLKFVYDKLGIQPYVVFRKYDASLVSDSDKIKYCEKWYNENIKNEDTFLFMYFAEKDSDKDIGYMAYWAGGNAVKLSNKFESIFEAGINKYWFTDLSTDDVIKSTFEYTCDSIKIE